MSVGESSAAGRKDGADEDRKCVANYTGGHSHISSRGRPSKQTPAGRRDMRMGCRVGEAKNPGPPNPGESPLPESKRLKTGPEFHITLPLKPDGEIGHLRRTTLSPKDTTDRVRYRWQALAPGKCRCFLRDLTSPAASFQSWHDKYHPLLTDECRVEFHQEISRRTAAEASGSTEDAPSLAGTPDQLRRRGKC